MSKPQWKIDLENKERVVKEREEAERKAKADKMASLGFTTHSEEVAPASTSQVPEELPELGLVAKDEAIDHEKVRLQRHLDASAATSAAAQKKTSEQIAEEKKIADQKAEEQARSDAIAAKMQRKMAEFQAQQAAKAHSSGSSGLVITTEEEDYDEEAKKRQAAMTIGKFIGK